MSNGNDSVSVAGGYLSLELSYVGTCPHLGGPYQHILIVCTRLHTRLRAHILRCLCLELLLVELLLVLLMFQVITELQTPHGIDEVHVVWFVVCRRRLSAFPSFSRCFAHLICLLSSVFCLRLALRLQVQLLHILMVVLLLQLMDKHRLLLRIARELFLRIQLKDKRDIEKGRKLGVATLSLNFNLFPLCALKLGHNLIRLHTHAAPFSCHPTA